ncbi:MAG: hypothetical protein ACNI27_12980 [Desulfovibrio sp.]
MPQTETVILAPPPELTVCAEDPELPSEPLTDQDVGEYILRLHEAYEDCAGTLERVRVWGDDARARLKR